MLLSCETLSIDIDVVNYFLEAVGALAKESDFFLGQRSLHIADDTACSARRGINASFAGVCSPFAGGS